MDTMELEVGYGLIPLVDRDQDGSLLGASGPFGGSSPLNWGLSFPRFIFGTT